MPREWRTLARSVPSGQEPWRRPLRAHERGCAGSSLTHSSLSNGAQHTPAGQPRQRRGSCMTPRTVVLTALALVCFARNSLLSRGALAAHEIDAASFTAVRVVSGAAVLVLLGARRLRGGKPAWNWLSAFALFLYAAPFSFAYLRLGAALGALVLFGVVQV